MPERETFDELVRAARQLAERLDGKITDQHGEELTPQRIARLRQSLESRRRRLRGPPSEAVTRWRKRRPRSAPRSCATKSTATTTVTTSSTSRRFRTPNTTG